MIGILDRRTDLVKSYQQALPVCRSLVNNKGIESNFLCKAPRTSARVLTVRHAPTSRQGPLSKHRYTRQDGCKNGRHRTIAQDNEVKELELGLNKTIGGYFGTINVTFAKVEKYDKSTLKQNIDLTCCT